MPELFSLGQTNHFSRFYNIGWNALAYTYLVELFPYSQRAQGIAVEQLAVRIAVFFNTYVNPIALDAIGWRYYIVYCVWILFEIATVYFLFPETKVSLISFLLNEYSVQMITYDLRTGLTIFVII